MTDKYANREAGNILREIIFIIFYHKRMLLTIGCTTCALLLALAVLLPPQYLCRAKFSVSMSQQIDPLQKDVYTDSKNQYLRVLTGQKEIILSNRVLSRAARSLFPDRTEAEYQKIVTKLSKDIEVTPPKGESFEVTSDFIITYDNSDPQLAFKTVETVSNAYQEVFSEITKQRTEYSYEFFKGQVANLYAAMQAKADLLKTYESENALALVDILNLEGNKGNTENGTKTLLNAAQTKRQSLREEYVALEQTINDLETSMTGNHGPAILPEMEGSGKAITAYSYKVAQLRMQIQEMETQFTPQYEPLIRIKQELQANITLLQNETQRYIAGKRIQLAGISSMLAELDQSIVLQEDSLRSTAQLRSTYAFLRQDYDLAWTAYAEASTKLEQARQANALSRPDLIVTLVDPATIPMTPYKPNRIGLAVLGLFLGLFLGLAAAFTLDYFDHSIKTPEDIDRWCDVPLLGSLPQSET
ncbi:GumC family protein [Solidesulfovibrio sp.]